MAPTIFSLSSLYPCWSAILQHLNLNTIKILRLTNRQFAEQCLIDDFLKCVATQTIELIPEGEDEALAALCKSPLSAHVKALNIVNTVYDSQLVEQCKEVDDDIENHGIYGFPYSKCLRTLSQVGHETLRKQRLWLLNRKAATEGGIVDEQIISRLTKTFRSLSSLRGLSLEARFCHRPGDYTPAYQPINSYEQRDPFPVMRDATCRLFDLVMTSICQSGVTIGKLDAFWEHPGCDLPISNLLASLRNDSDNSKAKAFSAMSDVSLRVCAGTDDKVWNVSGSNALPLLLQAASGLKSLALRTYNPSNPIEVCGMFSSLARGQYVNTLTRCVLSGILITSADMTRFLSRQGDLEYLELSRVKLVDGREWQSLLSEVPRLLPGLKSLVLSRLSTAQEPRLEFHENLISLETTWMDLPKKPSYNMYDDDAQVGFFYCREGIMWHTVTLSSADLQMGLELLPQPGKWTVRGALNVLLDKTESPKNFAKAVSAMRRRGAYGGLRYYEDGEYSSFSENSEFSDG